MAKTWINNSMVYKKNIKTQERAFDMNSKEINMDSKKFVKKLRKYSKGNSFILISSFVLIIIFSVITLGGILKDNHILIQSEFYISMLISMLICSFIHIVANNISIKIRNKYVELFDESKLLYLLNYILKDNKKLSKNEFVELRYFFTKGLFFWMKNHEFIKYNDLQRETMLKEKKITKKQFLLISIFKCISIHDNDINSKIYVSQFLKLIKKYNSVLENEQNNGCQYIHECFEIEKEFQTLKEEAEQTQKYSYTKDQSFIEIFCIFCSDYRLVKITKKILLVMTILAVIFQDLINSEAMSNIFNMITIILLAIDIGSDK